MGDTVVLEMEPGRRIPRENFVADSILGLDMGAVENTGKTGRRREAGTLAAHTLAQPILTSCLSQRSRMNRNKTATRKRLVCDVAYLTL